MNSVNSILSRLQDLRVAIIGDFCLDIYLLVDDFAGETSIETGLTTKPVFEQRFSLGGAGNVAANLKSIGVGAIEVFGVVGDDPYGREMRRIIEALGINHTYLRVQPELWQTCAYTKLYHGDREEPRVDFGNFNRLDARVGIDLLSALESRLHNLDVVVINQQLECGMHTDDIRAGIRDIIASHTGTLFIADCRKFSNEYQHAVRKINDLEGATITGNGSAGPTAVDFSDARTIAQELYQRWDRPLFMTRGEHGVLVADEDGISEIPALLFLQELDTVGAGDSMLAGIVGALGVGELPVAAADFGTLVAGVTVQKLRATGTADPDEIIELARNASYAHNPELAGAAEKAEYLEGADECIEIVADLQSVSRRKGLVRHVIFDHDGTISTLREGWPETMEQVMMWAILGNARKKLSEERAERIRRRVLNFIDQTTGVQTLVQMYGLVELVSEFGLVPKEKILSAERYKELYDEALMKFVKGRIDACSGSAEKRKDFTIRGSVEFLKGLHGHGVSLYLASGTDEKDVKREAEVLGYADYFTEIVGARGDVDHEPKRIAIGRILDIVGDGGADAVAMVGDGPVEIREARRCGGLAVGVASDEVHPGRLNVEKRKRLILAGADLIIADFLHMDRLTDLVI